MLCDIQHSTTQFWVLHSDQHFLYRQNTLVLSACRFCSHNLAYDHAESCRLHHSNDFSAGRTATPSTTTACAQGLLFPLFWQGGVEKLGQLRVLYLSNNKIRDWTEVDRLAAAEKLEDLLLVGNPLYNDYRDTNAIAEYRVEVCRQL
jgi:hypothetical protein